MPHPNQPTDYLANIQGRIEGSLAVSDSHRVVPTLHGKTHGLEIGPLVERVISRVRFW